MKHRAIRPASERFWEKVDKAGPIPKHHPELGPCWVWGGGKSRDGYGRFRPGRASEGMAQAHRWSLEQALGTQLARENHACHRCDNPPCVNPEHLFEGSLITNEADKDAKGRRPSGVRHGRHTMPQNTARGERCGRAKLTEQSVRRIRSRVGEGMSQASVAREFGITPTIVSRILQGKIWKHVA